MKAQPLTAAGVIEVVRDELKEGSSMGGGLMGVRSHLRRARELQRAFRIDPVGGRFSGLKKALFWWTASAFDRQAKAIEAMLDAVEELASRQAIHPQCADSPSVPVDTFTANRRQQERHVSEGLSLTRALEVGAEMLPPERVLLYSLVFGLRPERSLEIGTFRGGSAAMMCAALDDVGTGRLVCVDPEPKVLEDAARWMERRATVIRGYSPDALAEAREVAGGPFDFALIDGDHSDEGVLRDVEGTLPHLADEAHLLFHDCHYAHVRDGIDEALRRHEELIDAGVLSTLTNPLDEVDDKGRPVVWGGLRLLRYLRRPSDRS
ncbi:MAG: class I SAM-dependent methyltransferase [Thermoanaerobaculia bacterium]|nr:class I SAM-dependent methyltransferase [Thermoanaerobaculia bacterium]